MCSIILHCCRIPFHHFLCIFYGTAIVIVTGIKLLTIMLTILIPFFDVSVPAKLVEVYLNLRRSTEEHVRVCTTNLVKPIIIFFLFYLLLFYVACFLLFSIALFCYRVLLNHLQINSSQICIPWSSMCLH